jgi:hypothetical protein
MGLRSLACAALGVRRDFIRSSRTRQARIGRRCKKAAEYAKRIWDEVEAALKLARS